MNLCVHCIVLTEAASATWKAAGLPRSQTVPIQKCVQRAIFHLQREMEQIALLLPDVALVLCDRGTPDNLAYWPGGDAKEWGLELNTTIAREIARYDAVIHLEPAKEKQGYENTELRIESPAEALKVDDRIAKLWAGHTNYRVVTSRNDFISKAKEAMDIINELVPDCCVKDIHKVKPITLVASL